MKAVRVVELLDQGLEKWNALDPERQAEVLLGEGSELETDPRWEWSYPESGLVLRSINRDLPTDGLPSSDPPHPRYNVDHAWFSAEEAMGFDSAACSIKKACASSRVSCPV